MKHPLLKTGKNHEVSAKLMHYSFIRCQKSQGTDYGLFWINMHMIIGDILYKDKDVQIKVKKRFG